MYKIFIVLIVLPSLLFSQVKSKIKGFKKAPNGTLVYLQNRLWETTTIDSTIITDNQYTFDLKSNEPFYGSITYENFPGYRPILIGVNKTIDIIDTSINYSILNSVQNNILADLEQKLNLLFRESNKLVSLHIEYEKKDSVLSKKYYSEYLILNKKAKKIIKEKIVSTKHTYLPLAVLYKYYGFFSKKEIFKLLQNELKKEKRYSLYSDFINYAKSDIIFSVGKFIENYCWEDSLKQNFCLDSITNYILLDIWATWCRPCLEIANDINEIDSTYRNKGLKTIRLSIDTENSFENWKRYISKAKDKSILELIDLNGWNSKFLKEKGIKSIPCILILDSNKKIIGIGKGKDDINKIKAILKREMLK